MLTCHGVFAIMESLGKCGLDGTREQSYHQRAISCHVRHSTSQQSPSARYMLTKSGHQLPWCSSADKAVGESATIGMRCPVSLERVAIPVKLVAGWWRP